MVVLDLNQLNANKFFSILRAQISGMQITGNDLGFGV
jgi:hypothetical protein